MSDPNKPPKTSSHRRKNNSGELDVFEAARYFSGVTDENPGPRTAPRMSLDIPIMNNPINDQDNNLALDPKKLIKENKKYKQPSSPGGKIASFLNSLFNQTTSKKKKSKSKSGSKVDLEEESANARRKRSSISHFRITTSTDHHNSNGSRTPPPCLDTPTKSYKDFRSFFDRQKVKSINCVPDKRLSIDCDENFRFSNGNIFKNIGFSENSWRDEEREFRKFSDFDDGGDTDSSSDLFDLPNCELDFYSSGLPVYGTTNVDKIRIARATK